MRLLSPRLWTPLIPDNLVVPSSQLLGSMKCYGVQSQTAIKVDSNSPEIRLL